MTHDSYFMVLVEVFTNHNLTENTYLTNHIVWTELKIMVLKSANKYQIIRYYHNFENIVINDFRHHFISSSSKSLSNIFKKILKTRQLTIQIICLLFDLVGCQRGIS